MTRLTGHDPFLGAETKEHHAALMRNLVTVVTLICLFGLATGLKAGTFGGLDLIVHRRHSRFGRSAAVSSGGHLWCVEEKITTTTILITRYIQRVQWSEWRDSNPRPLVPQTSALTGLRYTPTDALIGKRPVA